MSSSLAKTHANYSHDWWTPPEWMEWVEATIGYEGVRIFDPCPRDWNGTTSGLDVEWDESTYCNHPGSRGSARRWWGKYIAEQKRQHGAMRFTWCQFNVESIRQLYPSPFHVVGWLVWPRERTPFIWGGPDMPEAKSCAARVHGEPMKSPGNCAVWWTTDRPATPPVDSVIIRTGR